MDAGKKQLSQLSLKELEKLNFSSLFLEEMGILDVLGLILTLVLYAFYGAGTNIGAILFKIAYCIGICAEIFILFKIRNKAARMYLFIKSIVVFAGCAWLVFSYLSFMSPSWYASIYEALLVLLLGGLIVILPLFIGINLLIATKRELLWGEGRFSRAQIKKARQLKKKNVSFEDEDLPPAGKAMNPVAEKVFVAGGYAFLILSVLISVAAALAQ